MPPQPMRRPFPVEQLLTALGHISERELNRQLGYKFEGTGGAVGKAVAAGGLNYVTADRWAIKCGLHPAYVWPNWIPEALHNTEKAA